MLLIELYQVGEGQWCGQQSKKEERGLLSAQGGWPDVNQGLTLQV